MRRVRVGKQRPQRRHRRRRRTRAPSRTRAPLAVLSFASCTLGWSNGLISSAQPATATANSARKKIRPEVDGAVRRRTSGSGDRRRRAPANAASSVCVGLVSVTQVGEHAIVAVDVADSPSGSSATGQDPRPCLPVDSAISCSTHSPKLSIGGETTNVSLSRPWRASSPSVAPSHSPEFDSRRVVVGAGLLGRPGSDAAAPRCSRPSTPPARARSATARSSGRRCRAGLRNTRRMPSSLAIRSSGLPGSVIDHELVGPGELLEVADSATASRSSRPTSRRR